MTRYVTLPLDEFAELCPDIDIEKYCVHDLTSLRKVEDFYLKAKVNERNLIVIYLPPSWKNSHLEDLFAPYGILNDARVIRHKNGASKGYGFVDFESKESADAAKNALNGYSVSGKNLKVQVAGFGSNTNLFVWHFPKPWSEEDLEMVFSRFGTICDVKVLRYPDGVSKQCGFVRLASHQSSKLAISILHRKPFQFQGQNIMISCQIVNKNGKPFVKKRMPVKHMMEEQPISVLQQQNLFPIVDNIAPTQESSINDTKKTSIQSANNVDMNSGTHLLPSFLF